MRLLVVMSVFNEEALVGRAVRSLAPLSPDELHLFDGAWRGGRHGNHTFAGSNGPSDDLTRDAALAACTGSFHWHGISEPWPSQEGKRTAMFHDVGAEPGDYLLVMDADETLAAGDVSDPYGIGEAEVAPGPEPEELRGWLAEVRPPSAAHVHMKCVGENDMPGVRGEWPHGDYAPFFKPELRLFAWDPSLVCVYPGRYDVRDRKIEAYKVAEPGEPAVPVAPLWMLHHGNDRTAERKEAKLAYYEAEHPERERWQQALG